MIIQEALQELSDDENDSEMEMGDDNVYIERDSCEARPEQFRVIPNVQNGGGRKRKTDGDIFLNRAKKLKHKWDTKISNTGAILSRCDPPEDADESYDVDGGHSSTSATDFGDPCNDTTMAGDENEQRYTEDFLNQHGDNTFRNYIQNVCHNYK